MAVQRIFLDAAYAKARACWTSPSFGFSVITEKMYKTLAMQYTLVENSRPPARCLKIIPSKSVLLEQVSLTVLCFVV